LRSLLIASSPRQHVPEGFHHQHKSTSVAVATDLDDSTPGKYDLPSPSTTGALAPLAPATDKAGKPLTNGAGAAIDTDDNKRWVERAGWAPRFGNGAPVEDDSPADHQTWIEGKLDDKFFGGTFARSHGAQF
jgi:hypothetical protein